VYTEVLYGLTAVLKQSAAKGETTKTTITAPPSIDEFSEKRRKRKPTDDANERAKKPTTFTTEVSDSQFQSKPEVPTRNFFAPQRSIEMEADDTT
jgi:hypothetical protein